ncbi:MAG: flavodoxin family protein [Thermoguttaceae bacterium]|nr:flavodoxin family protein [Thermoguttaceae bacterium]
MKVLLINGSPHKNGSTNVALEEVAATLREEGVETTIFQLGPEPVSGCRGCSACSKLGKCVINDKVNEFMELAKDFDGYIVGAPVHYGSSAGNIASFLDRVFFVNFCANRRIFEHKPGAAVVVARRSGTTATLDQLNKYFSITQMPVISGRYWNMVHGKNADDVGKDLEGMQNMRILARNFAWHLKCRKAAEDAGIPMPKEEEVVFTNFIR